MSWKDIIKRGGGMAPEAQNLADIVMSSGEKLTAREVMEKIIQELENRPKWDRSMHWSDKTAIGTARYKVPTERELHRYLKDNYSSAKEKRNHPLNIDEANPVRVNATVYFKEG